MDFKNANFGVRELARRYARKASDHSATTALRELDDHAYLRNPLEQLVTYDSHPELMVEKERKTMAENRNQSCSG